MRHFRIMPDGSLAEITAALHRAESRLRSGSIAYEIDDYWPDFETPLPDDGMRVNSWPGTP